MSKEIKFKVWDNWNKKFLDYGEVDIWDLIFAEPKLMEEIYTDGMANECLEFLQYTGITDKNGVEIYEGDIIRFENTNYEIRFFKKWGMFGLVGKSSYKDFIEEDPLGSGGSSTKYKPYVLGEYYQKRIEVIGNIYENKELLYKII